MDKICAEGGNPYFGNKLLQVPLLLARLVHAWELLDGIHLHIKSDAERERLLFVGKSPKIFGSTFVYRKGACDDVE